MDALTQRGSLFDDLFRDFAPGFFVRPLQPLHGEGLPSQIKVDVKENGEVFTVVADLPGVSRDAIHVDIEGDTVSLRAEISQQDQQTRDERVLRSERYYGSVARSFRLPQEVESNRAKAKFENGVLTLTLPKKGETAGRRLVIE